jgi:hypothetical protein
MAGFTYRCPNTGRLVQGWIAEEISEDDESSYQGINCLACTRLHFVNPTTGKVLGTDDE